MEIPLIYVIDDDRSVRKSLERILRAWGFPVHTLGSAREFLGKNSIESARCLILDVRMPDINGLELQEKLIDSSLDIPIIFITAHDDPLDCRRGLDAGAVAYLNKPLDEEELIMAICKATGFKYNDLGV